MIELKVTTTAEQFREIFTHTEAAVVGLRLSPVDTIFFRMEHETLTELWSITVRETVIAETLTTLSKQLHVERMYQHRDEAIEALWKRVVQYKKFVNKSMYNK